MKKYLSILCALVLMSTAFVSCGSSDDDDEKEKSKSSASDEKDDDDEDDDDDDDDDSKKKSKKDDSDLDDDLAKTISKAASSAMTDLDSDGEDVMSIAYIVTMDGDLQAENIECSSSLAEDLVDGIGNYYDDFDKVPYAFLTFEDGTCTEVFISEGGDEKPSGIYSNADDADDLAKLTFNEIYDERRTSYKDEEEEEK